MLPVLDPELEGVLALPHPVLHGDHAGVHVEGEVWMRLVLHPLEGLVRNVPVVLVVDVDASNLCAWRLALVTNSRTSEKNRVIRQCLTYRKIPNIKSKTEMRDLVFCLLKKFRAKSYLKSLIQYSLL